VGLHAEVNHFGREVNIAVEGTLSKIGLAQIEAMIQHFQDRGCDRIRFDFRDLVPAHDFKNINSTSFALAPDRPLGEFPLCEHL
jgi:hypothetical protein